MCVSLYTVGSLTLFTDLKRPTASIDRSLQTGDVNMVGGRWYPTHCVARHRIAIIVPYRNREEHLRRLVYALHPVLQRQQLDYTIFVVEQVSNQTINLIYISSKHYMNFPAARSKTRNTTIFNV